MQLALVFEAHSGRTLPASTSAVLKAEVMSLHERARVLGVVLSILQKHVVQGSLLCSEMTSRANSLVPMGAGLIFGLTALPYFTRRGRC